MNPYNTNDIFGGNFSASAMYDAVKVQLASPETIPLFPRKYQRKQFKQYQRRESRLLFQVFQSMLAILLKHHPV